MKTYIKLLPPVILIISILLLIYVFYLDKIYWNERKYYIFKNYYLISYLLISFSIITFFVSNKIKEYLFISITTIILTLYLFEGYLTFNQISKKQFHEKQSKYKRDIKTKFEIYKDRKKINDKVVMRVSPNSYLKKKYPIFPLSGISNSETIYCNENEYYSIYQSDRYGFNNPDEEWNKKEIEYLLVGDSFAHGACVNRPNDIASVLRNLSGKSVLNLGYGGNGPLIEYATLREYLNKNVKKILWIYFTNDPQNLQNEEKKDILINYLNNLTFSQNLKLKQKEINNLALKKIKIEMNEVIKKNSFKYELLKFAKLNQIRKKLLLRAPLPIPKPSSNFKKILNLTKDLAYQNNAKLYFIYLPGDPKSKIKNNDNYNFVKNLVNELQIPFIDIQKEVIEKELNPYELYPNKGGHFNIKGYKKVAETIYQFTKN